MSPAASRRWRIAAGLGWLAAVAAFFGWSRGVSVNDRSAFRRWTTRWMVMSLLGFAAFAVAPTAPPWAAARCTPAEVREGPVAPRCLYHHAVDPAATILGNAGAQAHAVVRESWRGFDALHVQLASRAFQTGENVTDRVAAAPLLHACGARLVSLFLWRRVRAGWRPLLVAYPPAMGFALVYGANHYVFDILVGWAFALFTVGLCRAAEALVARRRAAVPAGPAAPTPARDDVAVPVLS